MDRPLWLKSDRRKGDGMSDDAIFVGASDADQYLLLKYANRHGLVAGATGTGKTVTLQTIAEGFSAYGVPVFMADVKGDLSGVSQARRQQSAGARAREAARHRRLCRPRLPDDLLGPVRREGPSHPHDGERSGPGADGPPAAAQRDAGRRAQHRLQAGRPAGPAAARLQATCRRCCNGSPRMPAPSPPNSAMSASSRSAPSSASS